MLRLTDQEESYFVAIERRVGYLHAPTLPVSVQVAKRFEVEKAAMEWALEVVAHAAATNCEAAFAATQLRRGEPEQAIEYFRDQAIRMHRRHCRKEQAKLATQPTLTAAA